MKVSLLNVCSRLVLKLLSLRLLPESMKVKILVLQIYSLSCCFSVGVKLGLSHKEYNIVWGVRE